MHPFIIRATHVGKDVNSPEGVLQVLADIDLAVKPGESVAIVGPSGSGKSSLLALLAGLDLPTRGAIEMLGQSLSSLSEDQRARLRAGNVGFVFQNFQLLPHLDAIENVAIALELKGERDATTQARHWLQRVGLAARGRHLPVKLSGGEQQRVAIARAFIGLPKLLFADEPTGNLDIHTGQQIARLLFELNREQGTTLVLVTHDPGLAAQCDRTVRLVEGRIVEPDPLNSPAVAGLPA